MICRICAYYMAIYTIYIWYKKRIVEHFLETLIVSIGTTEQASLYIFKKNVNGWKVDEPHIISLQGMIKDADMKDKTILTGFLKMVYVKVSNYRICGQCFVRTNDTIQYQSIKSDFMSIS